MLKVTGEFEITLRTPIYVSFDFNVNKRADLHLEVDGNNISIRPLALKPHIADEEGDLIEPPSVVNQRKWHNLGAKTNGHIRGFDKPSSTK